MLCGLGEICGGSEEAVVLAIVEVGMVVTVDVAMGGVTTGAGVMVCCGGALNVVLVAASNACWVVLEIVVDAGVDNNCGAGAMGIEEEGSGDEKLCVTISAIMPRPRTMPVVRNIFDRADIAERYI